MYIYCVCVCEIRDLHEVGYAAGKSFAAEVQPYIDSWNRDMIAYFLSIDRFDYCLNFVSVSSVKWYWEIIIETCVVYIIIIYYVRSFTYCNVVSYLLYVVYVFMCTYYYIPQLVRLRELNENRICIFPLFYCTRLFWLACWRVKKKNKQ